MPKRISLFDHHDYLSKVINSRLDEFGLRGKKRLEALIHITAGAAAMADALNLIENPEDNESSLSPLIFFCSMRGDDWTMEWEKIKLKSQSNNQTSGESGSEKAGQ